MAKIAQNILDINKTIPHGVELVAVSKYNPASSITEAYDAGQRIFGESRVQELLPKAELLPKDIEWHFIGHLQTNKVKYIVPIVSLIHSGDSEKLLVEINKVAQKCDKKVNCLLQLHVAEEETKSGFLPQELLAYMESDRWRDLKNINIVGVMGMATYTTNQQKIRLEFETIKGIYTTLKDTYFVDREEFKECSMGMSHDYKLAIECGATLVRIGSSIFGDRY